MYAVSRPGMWGGKGTGQAGQKMLLEVTELLLCWYRDNRVVGTPHLTGSWRQGQQCMFRLGVSEQQATNISVPAATSSKWPARGLDY